MVKLWSSTLNSLSMRWILDYLIVHYRCLITYAWMMKLDVCVCKSLTRTLIALNCISNVMKVKCQVSKKTCSIHKQKMSLIPLFQLWDGSRTHPPLKIDLLLKKLIYLRLTLQSSNVIFTPPFTSSKILLHLKKLSLHLTLQSINNEHQVIFFVCLLEPLFWSKLFNLQKWTPL